MRAFLILIAILFFGISAYAQDAATIERLTRDTISKLLGTVSVQAHADFGDGKLSGCSVEYNVMARDTAYKQGAFIKVGGSFGLMSVKGTMGAVLKVLLNDVDARTMTFTPSPPASAYFIGGTNTTKSAMVASYPSDTPGGIFVVFQLDPTFEIISQGLSDNKLTIAFARTKGGMDIVVPIDTSVVDTNANGERTRSQKTMLDFFECTKALAQQTLR